MGTQRFISTSFWDDPWIRKLSPEERYMYLYLMTNTLTNIAGCYQISMERICFDTSYPVEKVRQILSVFEKAGKAFFYNEECMVLPKWPKYQKWENNSKIKSGIDALLKNLPVELLQFLKKIGYAYPIDALSISYTYPSSYLNKDIDINLDKDIDINSDPSASAPDEIDFSDPQKLFLFYWQHTPDIFNAVARIEKPKEWDHYWKTGPPTCEQVKTAMDNFISDVREGLIEHRFVPAMPDRFILKGWIIKCQKRFKAEKTGPPSHKIKADQVRPEDAAQYFREA